MYVVTEPPKAVYEVRGVTKVSEINLRVSVSSGDGALNLVAADGEDGQAWFSALERASNWDGQAAAEEVSLGLDEAVSIHCVSSPDVCTVFQTRLLRCCERFKLP